MIFDVKRQKVTTYVSIQYWSLYELFLEVRACVFSNYMIFVVTFTKQISYIKREIKNHFMSLGNIKLVFHYYSYFSSLYLVSHNSVISQRCSTISVYDRAQFILHEEILYSKYSHLSKKNFRNENRQKLKLKFNGLKTLLYENLLNINLFELLLI